MIFTFAYAYKCEFLTVLVFKYSVKMDVLKFNINVFSYSSELKTRYCLSIYMLS